MTTLRDSVHIDRPAADVWAVIENPENLPSWNPKVVRVEPLSSGDRRAGFRYEIAYRMSGRERAFVAEYEEYQEPHRLRVRLTGARGTGAEELYELTPTSRGTRLERTMGFSVAGVPLVFRWLTQLLFRFGRPRGTPYLETLKRIVETSGAAFGS